MTQLLPVDVLKRPRAATRFFSRGSPLWRLTVVFQGGVGMQVAHGENLILGAQPDTDKSPDRNPMWGLSMVVAGTVTVTDRVTRDTVQLGVGDWFHFAGRPVRELVLHPGPGFIEMSISTNLGLGGLLDQLGLWPTTWYGRAKPDANLVSIGWELHRALLDPVIADCSLLRRVVHLIDLVRHATSSDEAAGDGFRARACQLLAAHQQPSYAVAHAAKVLRLSEQAFRKRFAREVGLPPGRWQQLRRMESASAFLLTQSVGSVANRLGYSDAATFSRQFRQATGVNPSSLRRRG